MHALRAHASEPEPPEPGDDATLREPTSEFLTNLVSEITDEQISLGWIVARLGERSFGLFLLILGVLGIAPGLSTFIAILLFVPAVQMILVRAAPRLPRRVAAQTVRTAQLRYAIEKTAPLLRWVERLVKPRWPTGDKITMRAIGIVVLLLAATMLTPIPFSQVIPAAVVILIAVAYLEDDGLMLAIGFALAVVSLATTGAAIWGAVLAGEAVVDSL